MKGRTFFDSGIMKTKCLDIQLSEGYTKLCQTSKKKLSAVNYFHKKTSFYMFDKVLNKPMTLMV